MDVRDYQQNNIPAPKSAIFSAMMTFEFLCRIILPLWINSAPLSLPLLSTKWFVLS